LNYCHCETNITPNCTSWQTTRAVGKFMSRRQVNLPAARVVCWQVQFGTQILRHQARFLHYTTVRDHLKKKKITPSRNQKTLSTVNNCSSWIYPQLSLFANSYNLASYSTTSSEMKATRIFTWCNDQNVIS
jgi:hypothetical protein